MAGTTIDGKRFDGEVPADLAELFAAGYEVRKVVTLGSGTYALLQEGETRLERLREESRTKARAGKSGSR